MAGRRSNFGTNAPGDGLLRRMMRDTSRVRARVAWIREIHDERATACACPRVGSSLLAYFCLAPPRRPGRRPWIDSRRSSMSQSAGQDMGPSGCSRPRRTLRRSSVDQSKSSSSSPPSGHEVHTLEVQHQRCAAAGARSRGRARPMPPSRTATSTRSPPRPGRSRGPGLVDRGSPGTGHDQDQHGRPGKKRRGPGQSGPRMPTTTLPRTRPPTARPCRTAARSGEIRHLHPGCGADRNSVTSIIPTPRHR